MHEGLISSDDVLDSLENYDVVAGQWLLAHRFTAKHLNKFIVEEVPAGDKISDVRNKDLVDKDFAVLKPIWRIDDGDQNSVEGQLQTQIEAIVARNTALYLRANPNVGFSRTGTSGQAQIGRAVPQDRATLTSTAGGGDPFLNKT